MSDASTQTQWFTPTNGRLSGGVGVTVAAVIVAIALFRTSWLWVAGGLLIGLVVWMVLLRPTVGLRGRTLILRGVASTVEIPLSLVTSSTVRQVFVAWVGEKRYVSAALGRPYRQLRDRRDRPAVSDPYIDQVLALIAAHQSDALRWGDEGGGVRRRWALPELIAALVLVLIVFGAL